VGLGAGGFLQVYTPFELIGILFIVQMKSDVKSLRLEDDHIRLFQVAGRKFESGTIRAVGREVRRTFTHTERFYSLRPGRKPGVCHGHHQPQRKNYNVSAVANRPRHGSYPQT
jgi:hypothetical protein